ncbi:MAG: hypothetical protein ABIK98_02145 [Pseudomonadota bacterium]|uniref:Uncharacterized protein n=1 Tax=Candidatus Desulfatibia profunda TaxID=2841695 RepID=A0A8J6NXC0_9BACT|nr:hypothetical protein [Candidatus Desulfatibia profunda]MBL7180925.1 hypothetical protein [Desulfobacterales bacterium]
MSTTINNSVQNLSVIQKEFEQPNLEKQRVKTEKSQDYNSDIAKDTVEIQNSSRGSIKSSQDSNEIKDAEEAQKTVEDVVRLINSESDKLQGEQIHKLDPGSIVDLLA